MLIYDNFLLRLLRQLLSDWEGTHMKASNALLGVVTVSLALFSSAAFAQMNTSSIYVGGSLGEAQVKDYDCAGLATCEDSDTAWRIFAGYQFNQNFAVELGYHNLGEISAAQPGIGSERAEATAWEIVAVGSWPVTPQFSVYGKAGLYRAETEGSFDLTPIGLGTGSADESNNDITFGFGVRYDATRNLGVRLEWQRYSDVGGGDIGESDIDVLSVGVMFRFQ